MKAMKLAYFIRGQLK